MSSAEGLRHRRTAGRAVASVLPSCQRRRRTFFPLRGQCMYGAMGWGLCLCSNWQSEEERESFCCSFGPGGAQSSGSGCSSAKNFVSCNQAQLMEDSSNGPPLMAQPVSPSASPKTLSLHSPLSLYPGNLILNIILPFHAKKKKNIILPCALARSRHGAALHPGHGPVHRRRRRSPASPPRRRLLLCIHLLLRAHDRRCLPPRPRYPRRRRLHVGHRHSCSRRLLWERGQEDKKGQKVQPFIWQCEASQQEGNWPTTPVCPSSASQEGPVR